MKMKFLRSSPCEWPIVISLDRWSLHSIHVLSTLPSSKLCNAYAQLGARGVSILFSSGDGGVSGTGFQECTTFVPTFPNTCP